EDFGTEKSRRIDPFIVMRHEACNISTGFSSFVGGNEITTPSNSFSSIAVEALLRSIQYLCSWAENQSPTGQTNDIWKVRPSGLPSSFQIMLSNSLGRSIANAPSFAASETVTIFLPPLSTGSSLKYHSAKKSARITSHASALIDRIGTLSGSILASSKRA